MNGVPAPTNQSSVIVHHSENEKGRFLGPVVVILFLWTIIDRGAR
jgi:hypothetical protein